MNNDDESSAVVIRCIRICGNIELQQFNSSNGIATEHMAAFWLCKLGCNSAALCSTLVSAAASDIFNAAGIDQKASVALLS